MPGRRINGLQVNLYMKARNDKKTQITSSAIAGISIRSGRRIDQRQLQPDHRPKRHWRTREDPFAEVWENELKGRLDQEPGLSATILFEELQQRDPDLYPDSKKRTLQRRVQLWKATYGKEKEVMFLQEHPPGRQALSDFTRLKKEPVTINGEPLKHLLYHFRLAFSGWCYASAVLGGESFTALATGLQEALWRLGGSPEEHRTDSLSAAFKNLDKDARKDITSRYDQLCENYTMKPTRNNRGKGHENGSVESPHGHLKWRIEQNLLLRQSRDFDTLSDYQAFLDKVTAGMNRRRKHRIEVERAALRKLPCHRSANYTECIAAVSSTSTIEVKRVLYSVPSRLVGSRLRIHLYDDHLKGYLGSRVVLELPRDHRPRGSERARQIDYCHLIGSLSKKPQAFRYSMLRDEILPNDNYRQLWKAADEQMQARAACKWIVGVLALAARGDCEEEIGKYLIHCAEQRNLPSIRTLEARFDKKTKSVPKVEVKQHSAAEYEQLLSTVGVGQ